MAQRVGGIRSDGKHKTQREKWEEERRRQIDFNLCDTDIQTPILSSMPFLKDKCTTLRWELAGSIVSVKMI